MPATLSLEAPGRRISVEAPRPGQRGSSAGTEPGRPGVPGSEDEASGGGRPRSRPEGGSCGAEAWGAGSRARLGSPGAGSRHGRPEPQDWDCCEGGRRPRGTSHLPSSPRSRPLGSPRPTFRGLQTRPATRRRTFHLPAQGGHCLPGLHRDANPSVAEAGARGGGQRAPRGEEVRQPGLGTAGRAPLPERRGKLLSASVPSPPIPAALSWQAEGTQ